MQKSKLSLLSVMCSVVIFAGCRKNEKPVIVEPQSLPVSLEPEKPTEEVAQVDVPPAQDFLQEALALGMHAAQLAKFAQDSSDWKTVNAKWLEAVKKLESISAESKDYGAAQKKVSEYKENANVALKKAEGQPSSQSPANTQSTEVLSPPTNIQMSLDQVVDKYNEEYCAEVQKIISEGQNVYDWTETAIHLEVMYPLLPYLQDIEDKTGGKIADAEFQILAKNKRQCI